MRRGSPTGFEVRIRFIVMFGKRSFLGFFLGCGAAKPIHETRRAEAGFSSRSRDEALIVQLCAKVASVDISVHFSCVSGCAQELADELIHSDRFGTSDLD